MGVVKPEKGRLNNGELKPTALCVTVHANAERKKGKLFGVRRRQQWSPEKSLEKEKGLLEYGQQAKRSTGDSRSSVENDFRYFSVKKNLSSNTISLCYLL